MNCADLERLLGLGDDDLRLEPRAVRAHFRDCGFCRRAFPEVLALVAAPAAEAPDAPDALVPPPEFALPRRRRWHEAAAAALILIALGLALAPPTPPDARARRAKSPAVAAVADRSFEVTKTRWLAGRPVTAHFEQRHTRLNPPR